LKVNLERTFRMSASAAESWALLKDVERVAGLMPGARITERIDDRHYKGTVAVKFGPANMSFRGEVEIAALEPSTRSLRLIGKGTDSTGGSGASMDLTARVDQIDAASSDLVGSSEVSISGKAAAFGGRMADSVAAQILKQFATNFAAELEARRSSGTVQGAAGICAAAAASPMPKSKPLSGFRLLWAGILGWLRAIIGSRGAHGR